MATTKICRLCQKSPSSLSPSHIGTICPSRERKAKKKSAVPITTTMKEAIHYTSPDLTIDQSKNHHSTEMMTVNRLLHVNRATSPLREAKSKFLAWIHSSSQLNASSCTFSKTMTTSFTTLICKSLNLSKLSMWT